MSKLLDPPSLHVPHMVDLQFGESSFSLDCFSKVKAQAKFHSGLSLGLGHEYQSKKRSRDQP